MDTSTLKNKKIIVTGSGGFVGGHLTARLRLLGAHVLEVMRDQLDVTKRKDLDVLFAQKPYACIHLAGEAVVEEGHLRPYETFTTNITGTLNVLELSRIYALSRIVIASTVHVYGNNRTPFLETDPPRPSRPYETSKTCTDLIAQSYADSFHLPVVIPRFVNIYGPQDRHEERIIPRIIDGIVRNVPIQLWKSDARREYLYIDDAIDGYIKLLTMNDTYMEQNRIFNFGTGKPFTLDELISVVEKTIGKKLSIRWVKPERTGEIVNQFVSWEKAKRVLGWQPATVIEKGLQQTIAWYKEKVSL